MARQRQHRAPRRLCIRCLLAPGRRRQSGQQLHTRQGLRQAVLRHSTPRAGRVTPHQHGRGAAVGGAPQAPQPRTPPHLESRAQCGRPSGKLVAIIEAQSAVQCQKVVKWRNPQAVPWRPLLRLARQQLSQLPAAARSTSASAGGVGRGRWQRAAAQQVARGCSGGWQRRGRSGVWACSLFGACNVVHQRLHEGPPEQAALGHQVVQRRQHSIQHRYAQLRTGER